MTLLLNAKLCYEVSSDDGIFTHVFKACVVVNDLHGRGAQRHSDGKDAHPVIQQIDLAPTLALLLGLPIPFSSLGMIIPELFLCNGGHSKNSTYLERVKVLNEALLVNVAQVFRYLVSISNRLDESQRCFQAYI